MITQARLKEVLRYRPETGCFYNLVDRNYNSPRGKRAGSVKCNARYRMISIDGCEYYEHHLAWLYVFGVWPDRLDHENGRGTENWIDNLREASQTLNLANADFSVGVTGFRGVYPDYRGGPSFNARIQVNRHQISLGYYDTKEQAALAYQEAAEYHFGEFAFQNRRSHLREVELRSTEGTVGRPQGSTSTLTEDTQWPSSVLLH